MGRQEDLSSKKKTKGRCRATPKNEEGSEAQDMYQDVEKEHSILFNSLEHEGIGCIVAREAVMNPSAALAFSQLTTIIDDLRRDLEWVNDACQQAENQLVITQRKRPVSLQSLQQGEDDHRPRKVQGRGEASQEFAQTWSSDHEGPHLGPSSIVPPILLSAGPSEQDTISAVVFTGQVV